MITSPTPGPWGIDGAAVFADGVEIAGPFSGSDRNRTLLPIDEREANARLIAAAPDLLAALIAFRDTGDGFVGWHPKYERAIELAPSAIAAATPPE